MRREEIERCRGADVTDEWSVRHGGRRGGDLAIGNAEEHHLGARHALVTTERAAHLCSRGAQGGSERGTHAAATDDGDGGHSGKLTATEVRGTEVPGTQYPRDAPGKVVSAYRSESG